MSTSELNARQQAILECVIRAYTPQGVAVSSADVAQDLKPVVSSATVRNDMVQLTDLGYLTQPHTSAGRVPTADGFRIVTEQLLERAAPRSGAPAPTRLRRGESRASSGREYAGGSFEPLRTAHRLAEQAHAAAFVAMRGRIGTAGFEFVFTAPELAMAEGALGSLARIVEALPFWQEQLREALDAPLGVFIAEENPITPTRHFSIVAAELPQGGIAAILGPIRMRYDIAIHSLMAL